MAVNGLLFYSKYILRVQSQSSQPIKFAHKWKCPSLIFPGGPQIATPLRHT